MLDQKLANVNYRDLAELINNPEEMVPQGYVRLDEIDWLVVEEAAERDGRQGMEDTLNAIVKAKAQALPESVKLGMQTLIAKIKTAFPKPVSWQWLRVIEGEALKDLRFKMKSALAFAPDDPFTERLSDVCGVSSIKDRKHLEEDAIKTKADVKHSNLIGSLFS
jgi:hypothetical protein